MCCFSCHNVMFGWISWGSELWSDKKSNLGTISFGFTVVTGIVTLMRRFSFNVKKRNMDVTQWCLRSHDSQFGGSGCHHVGSLWLCISWPKTLHVVGWPDESHNSTLKWFLVMINSVMFLFFRGSVSDGWFNLPVFFYFLLFNDVVTSPSK